jgi:hypothetical protein
MRRRRKTELEQLLRELEFPGEQEDFKEQAESRELTSAVMQRIEGARRAAGESAEAGRRRTAAAASESLGRRPGYWIAAVLVNLSLLFFFALGTNPAAGVILETGEFYAAMVFLFLGMSTSVSLAGAVLTVDVSILRRMAAGLWPGGR